MIYICSKYSFLELFTVDTAKIALELNGILFMGSPLKISRPKAEANAAASILLPTPTMAIPTTNMCSSNITSASNNGMFAKYLADINDAAER